MPDATETPSPSASATEHPTGDAGPRLLAGAGPLAIEEALVAALERALPAGAGALERLAAPVRVLVPSGALRLHLLAHLAHRRRAWLGLEVLTLRRMALSIVERAGAPPPRGAALLPVLVRRAALAQPPLARPLAPLEGGFAPLVGTVRDLLDAGLDPAHAAGLLERLADAETPLGGGERARAAAVVRVATGTAAALEELGLAAGAALYRHAAEAVRDRPDAVPPARETFLHGFADATGAITGLLEVLARHAPTTLCCDLPATATGSPRVFADEPFGRALREKIGGGRRPERIEAAPPVELDAFSASGETAEAREVARRTRAAITEGVAPEQIAIVVRDLGPYLAPLRRALAGAAIPFTLDGAAPAPPELRAALAVVRLLDERGNTRTDLVLDLLAPGLDELAPPAELRLAARALGATTLDELARVDLGARLGRADSLALPVRGLWSAATAEASEVTDETSRPRSRRLARQPLARFLSDCRRLARAVANLPERATASVHFAALGALAHAVLPVAGAAAPWLAGALGRLSADLPPRFELGRDEIAELLARAAEGIERVAPGGRGGGVQVLSVTAARSRTFARLFVVGLNRGVFPRAAVEDPLFPDSARRALRELLPDLPVKRERPFEERFLFDQLTSAAPHVTLSFPCRSDDATPRLVSPLLDRLSWRDEATRALRERWRHPVSPAAGEPPEDAPSLRDRALRAGLAGARESWAVGLAAAFAEARGAAATAASDRRLARARAETVAELDPDRRTAAGRKIWRALGPFLGRVGPGAVRRDPLWVTQVEGLHLCGWKTLLERGLGLEPLADPDLDLPAPLEPRLVGVGVHRLLERLFGAPDREGPPALHDLLEAPGREIPFPGEAALAAAAREVALRLLEEEGLAIWGFEALLARALVQGAQAAAVDWREGPPRVLGVEVDGAVDLAPWGAALTLAFRADRVDRDGDAVVLTDYKSWRPPALKRRVGGAKWLDELRRGALLQPIAYVGALAGAPARGRFLALGADDEDPPMTRFAALDESARAELEALATAARRAAAALDEGRLPPRLVDPSGFESGPGCRYCQVAEACLQGDSGARRRLREWTEDRRTRGPESTSAADRAEAELVLAADPLPRGETP